MALEFNQLLTLMKIVAKADPSATTSYSYNNESFSYEQLNETLRKEMNELVGTPALYRENKNLLFGLIEETISLIFFKPFFELYSSLNEYAITHTGYKSNS